MAAKAETMRQTTWIIGCFSEFSLLAVKSGVKSQCWLATFGTSATGDSVLSGEKAREEAIVLMLLREVRLRLMDKHRETEGKAEEAPTSYIYKVYAVTNPAGDSHIVTAVGDGVLDVSV